MNRRNKIVSMLMDKVPRKYREGYTPKNTMAGDLFLIELDDTGSIADFLASHNVFGEIESHLRRRMYDDLCANTVEHSLPGRRTTLLLKIRLHYNEREGLHTPLARLGMRFARMHGIAKDGVRNMTYDRNNSSSTMDMEKFLELAPDMKVVDCVCPDDLPPHTFDYNVNGIRVE